MCRTYVIACLLIRPTLVPFFFFSQVLYSGKWHYNVYSLSTRKTYLWLVMWRPGLEAAGQPKPSPVRPSSMKPQQGFLGPTARASHFWSPKPWPEPRLGWLNIFEWNNCNVPKMNSNIFVRIDTHHQTHRKNHSLLFFILTVKTSLLMLCVCGIGKVTYDIHMSLWVHSTSFADNFLSSVSQMINKRYQILVSQKLIVVLALYWVRIPHSCNTFLCVNHSQLEVTPDQRQSETRFWWSPWAFPFVTILSLRFTVCPPLSPTFFGSPDHASNSSPPMSYLP